MRYKILLVLMGLAVFPSGCADKAMGPKVLTGVVPKFLSVVAGDGQKDTVVHEVKLPIETQATSIDGLPINGVAVNYAVVDKDTIPYADARTYGFVKVPVDITHDLKDSTGHIIASGVSFANVVLGTLAMDTVRVAAFYNNPADGTPQLVEFIYIVALPDTSVTVTMAAENLTLLEGDTSRAEAVAYDQYSNVSADGLSWKSSDESVATVDESGLVHGVSPGAFNITAQVRNAAATARGNVFPVYDEGAVAYARSDNFDHSWLYSFDTPARGGAEAQLHDEEALFPRWSPDGGKLAFSNGGGIYTINADGSNQHKLGSTLPFDGSLSWSHIDGRIAAVSGGKIYTLSESTGETKSSCNLAMSQNWVDWSPDGGWFLFVSLVDSKKQIFVADSACTSATQLTTDGNNIQPRWSPAGDKIIYISDRNVSSHVDVPFGAGHIFMMSADGSHQESVWSAGAAAFPSFSPSGHFIVFSGNESSSKWSGGSQYYYRLYVMSSDGSVVLNPLPDPGQTHIAYWMADWR